MRYTVGIDAGASSVKVVAVADAGEKDAAPDLLWSRRAPHHGNAAAQARELLAAMAADLGIVGCEGVCVTGSAAESLIEVSPDLPALEDVPAIASGAAALYPHARSVIAIGGQNACYIHGIGAGEVPQFSMNESCASGTGSFFEDQMTRLGLSIEDYSDLVSGAKEVPRISGRCSVFAKTDIIHRQQEGAPVRDILLGLCYAMVKSFKALIVRGLPVEAPVVLAGGVSLNAGVVRAVREVFGLAEGGLICDEQALFAQATGAALHARGAEKAADLEGLLAALADAGTDAARASAADALPRLAPLPKGGYVVTEGFLATPRELWEPAADGRVHATLGIDVGSTSTNLVLLDRQGRLLDAQYLRTAGDARNAVREGLASLGERLGDTVAVDAVVTTGSGRGLMAKFVGADAAVDEITCQAAGAAHADPQVDTVFEIGGQDSKYISLSDGAVVDFQMNKVCAAGTGSFIEEQAARLGIPIADYGELALSAAAPIDLGERCTVFVETAINAALAAGASKADVAAGLALSIVRNYLHRVVGAKPVGSHIVLQGGVAYNPAIVEAFRAFWGDVITVSPYFAVSGAAGAALMAGEKATEPGFSGTAFKGFDLAGSGRTAPEVDQAQVALNRAFYARTEELFLKDYDGSRDPAKKTVGIPRCLMLHRLFPLANQFFSQLGYNVVLSPDTNEEIVALAQEHARGETCYPVKLIYGHMAWLAQQQVDYVFMPSVHTIRHASSNVAHNYACVYMQTAPRLVADDLGLEQRGIELLNPMLDMDFGQEAMAGAMLGLGTQLGHTPQETAVAMMAGGFAVTEFGQEMERLGDELLDSLAPDERVLVLITRNYGIADSALNMGIPDILLDHGQKVISLSQLHGGHDIDVSADHPGICWPFGQHIVTGAKLVRRDPRLFAVYLTNHGCGPDTMMDKLFAEEMGEKPYLAIECDEHFSRVGVITRVEAFLNALSHLSVEDAVRVSSPEGMPAASPVIGPDGHDCSACCGCGDGAAAGFEPAPTPAPGSMALSLIPEGGEVPQAGDAARVVVPAVGAYGELIAAALRARGLDARTAPLDAAALDAGRVATSTKEYCSFTALLGMSLLEAQKAANDGVDLHLVLPATRGAEADNQFERAIRAILRARGFGAVKIWAPRFETLPWELERLFGEGAAERFFDLLVEGDVATATADASSTPVDARRLALVGEWPLVYGDGLTGGIWRLARERGCRVVRMPLSEWFWMLWNDELVEDRTYGSHAAAVGMPWESSVHAHDHADAPDPNDIPAAELDRRAALLDALKAKMVVAGKKIGAVVGADANPFAANAAQLTAEADRLLPRFAGGNARYRIAKQITESRRSAGVVTAASLYENADTMIRLKEDSPAYAPAAPVLHLNFDGALDAGIAEKLSSFLYYV
ncbi:acyl-CoA dehydratase activase [Paratractidigestivibacter sp.]|uniref:acyl-CoA dehydratase activase n=1 Tax=Paratractidigestivibacter sp. TaxID=2847316 RepID=UPI002AC8CF77|nr:acyl-CoA dehydratase activase [Paratractidigestivibacter sp.]